MSCNIDSLKKLTLYEFAERALETVGEEDAESAREFLEDDGMSIQTLEIVANSPLARKCGVVAKTKYSLRSTSDALLDFLGYTRKYRDDNNDYIAFRADDAMDIYEV